MGVQGIDRNRHETRFAAFTVYFLHFPDFIGSRWRVLSGWSLGNDDHCSSCATLWRLHKFIGPAYRNTVTWLLLYLGDACFECWSGRGPFYLNAVHCLPEFLQINKFWVKIYIIHDPCINWIHTVMIPTNAHKCTKISFIHTSNSCLLRPVMWPSSGI